MERDTNINIRMNSKLKEDTKIVLENLGLDISAAIHLYFKQIVRHNGLPFELSNKELSVKTKEKQEIQNACIKAYYSELKKQKSNK